MNKLLFLAIFTFLGWIGLQIPVNTLVGSQVKFTLFDLYAPISGVFLGTGLGVLAVLLMRIADLLINGLSTFDKGWLIRLIPTLFAVWYFAQKNRFQLLIPLLAIITFNLHPIGRTVWFYSMFWLIPLLVWPLKDRFLVLRSLGSTFTAHSVGGAAWIWAFSLPATVWVSLIPVVILERAIFAFGISALFLLTNNLLALVAKNKFLTGAFSLDKNYLLFFLRK